MNEPNDRNLAEFEKWLNGEEFYNLMQTYRHTPITKASEVVEAFEAVKAKILSTQAEWEAALIRERDILKSSVETYIRLVSGLEHGQAEREKAAVAEALGEMRDKLDKRICLLPRNKITENGVYDSIALGDLILLLRSWPLFTPDQQSALDRHDAETREKVLGPIRTLVDELDRSAGIGYHPTGEQCRKDLRKAIQESNNAAK